MMGQQRPSMPLNRSESRINGIDSIRVQNRVLVRRHPLKSKDCPLVTKSKQVVSFSIRLQ